MGQRSFLWAQYWPQVIDNKVAGDTGFEPVTSPVRRQQRLKRKRRK
jgi:hypothetical protein